MIRRPPRSTQSRSSAASDVYKRQVWPLYRDGRGARLCEVPRRHSDGLVPGAQLSRPQAIAQPQVLHLGRAAGQDGGGAARTVGAGVLESDLDSCPGVRQTHRPVQREDGAAGEAVESPAPTDLHLSLIHISEPTRLGMISYAVFCLKKKKKQSK